MRKKHWYAIAFLGWMVFVTFSSLYSFKDSEISNFNIPYADKVVHFTFYFVAAVLGSLFLNEISGEGPKRIKSLKILALSLIFFGIIIEVIQEIHTVYRSGDVFDALANGLGVIVGIIAIFTQFQRLRGLK
ncbi:MAG: VanZ family protein [Maribacter sp.]|nr:VanZ family protein [Maribacter sp.]